jgi:23S rRNA (pseudouridine1915-N3)-methyltransferase
LKVTLLVVGRVRPPLEAAVEEYETRAKRYWKLEVVEVDGGAGGGNAPAARVMAAEEERLLQRVPPSAELVALTRVGDPIGSTELARYLGDLALRGSPGVAFVIGGAHGLGEGLLARARKRLSLSAFTLPHELARLVLAEQLYRAGTLLRGEPYHKGGGPRL